LSVQSIAIRSCPSDIETKFIRKERANAGKGS